jgi:hypothetical protein
LNKIGICYFIFLCIILISGCSLNSPSGGNSIVIEEDDKIFIQDQSGKSWDITHAVNRYGFNASNFQNGLGPYALTPINDPEFLEPGESGYPGNQETFLVIGTSINNDTRAYALGDLLLHEVVNERFDETYVSVAY